MDTDARDEQQDVPDHLAGSDVTGRGFLTGPGLHEFPVEYAVVDGVAIYDGCIDMGPVEEVSAEAEQIAAGQVRATTWFAGGGADGGGTDGSSAADEVVALGVGLPQSSSFLWTGGRVVYQIDAGVPDAGRVGDAIAHIEQNTPIRFVRRTAATAAALPNYVDIISNGNASWSSSAIGMRGGRQLLRLADGHPWPILAHEFLHALGVYHEQSRSDRDEYVEIKWNNIQDGPPPAGEINALGNFQKQPGSTDYFDYDYGSIMHYAATSFAKDRSKPTIVPRRPGVTIGQRSGLSFGDRQTVAKMYERFFPTGYAGVWRSGSGPYGLWVNAGWDSFRQKWEQWSGQGLRLADIHVRQTPAGTRYSGVYLAGSGKYGLWANASWDNFRAKWQQWSGQGLRLHDLHVHRVNGQTRYSGVFRAGSGGYGLWVNASWDSFRAKWQQWSGQGLRLHDLHVHRVNGQTRYSGVFLPGTGGYGLWANADWSSFVAKWREWSGQGLRLVDLNLHRSGNGNRYSGVFLAGAGSYYLWANVTWESLRAKWQQLGAQGLRLVDFEQLIPQDGGFFDDLGPADAGVPADEGLEEFGGIVDLPESAAAAPETLEGLGALVDPVAAPEGADAVDGDGGAEVPAADAGAESEEDDGGLGAVVLVESGTAESGTAESGTNGVLPTGARLGDEPVAAAAGQGGAMLS